MMAEGQGFSTSTWGGTPKHNCDQCAFDTSSLSAIKDHVRLAHNKLPVAPEAETTTSDAPKKVTAGKEDDK